ncbi:MAG: DUF3050 domain-containing protein [Bacteriovoracaceae bacterium]|nr:DUF3050 domain-containing protein [Bacteriovoracaceae bacterium]
MDQILFKQNELTHHPVYQTLSNLERLQNFMRFHVFAVWDFMSLLKSLQRHITCVELPWKPSIYPTEMVRLINQIVLGEESDLGPDGRPISHFELYLKGMEEVGASTKEIRNYVSSGDTVYIPKGARKFVEHNLKVAMSGHVVEVAANFFYGREKLIPDMFEAIVSILKQEQVPAPTLIYYLERHIEIDSGEHGPLALKCLNLLTGNDDRLKQLAYLAGQDALQMREQLWNEALLLND